MRRSGKLPELLAPAGDFECLVAAVAAGADAVYVGGRSYSARAYAKNFDMDELARAVEYCHLHGVRLYVTLNTLLYDRELEGAVEFARELYMLGVDALIIADLGLISILRSVLPELELHASTQLSVHNTDGADAAYELGCTRVVLARELSGRDIKAVTERCRAEVEVFLHGALCVCHSGQCLFSSMVGGRSGNRGECAQPCRLPYCGGKYPLSLSDLSLAHHIPELIESGVASLKIEGRMKSPSYVYTVSSIYRRLLDEGRGSTAAEDRELERAFSRGGFTDAYFRAHPEEKMTGVRSESDKADSRAAELGEFVPKRVRASAEVTLRLGEPSRLLLRLSDGRETVVFGDAPQAARTSALTAADVAARIAKMGNTFIELDASGVSVVLDEGINLSPAALNALRREAVAAISGRNAAVEMRPIPSLDVAEHPKRRHKTAIFYRINTYNKLSDALLGFDIVFLPLWRLTDGECRRTPTGIAMPPVIMESETDEVERMLGAARDAGIKYALVGNIGHLSLVRKYGMSAIGDFRFNVMNGHARRAVLSLGVESVMLSPELTAREAASIGGREIVYGRLPLMITERCFMRDMYGCRSCSEVGLSDRRGVEFPMVREFEHRNLIFNSAVTYIADKGAELSLFPEQHYIFTTESPTEVEAVIDAYKRGHGAVGGTPIRRIGRREVKK